MILLLFNCVIYLVTYMYQTLTRGVLRKLHLHLCHLKEVWIVALPYLLCNVRLEEYVLTLSPQTLSPFTPFTPWCYVLTTPWRLLTPCLFYSDLGLFILSIHNYQSITIHDCIILKLDITWFTCVIPSQPAKIQNGDPMYSLCFWLQNFSFRLCFYKQWYKAFSISTKQSI